MKSPGCAILTPGRKILNNPMTDAGFKQDADGNWYRPTLQELTRNDRIELAEKEIAYIVMGGQDGREYANSIAFILQVLDSLRDDS